jgi:hypothetical protein
MKAPDLSAEWYRVITQFADGTPGWVHTVAGTGTDAGLLLFAALFVAAWWRAPPGRRSRHVPGAGLGDQRHGTRRTSCASRAGL